MSRKSNPILASYLNRYFIETGTQSGHTVQSAIDIGFKVIHSIELDPSFYKKAAKRFIDHTNVTIHHGDSKDILPKIIADIDEPITFLLDAHYYNRSKTYRHSGPLASELRAIREHMRNDHTILIDDINRIEDFGFTKESVTEMLKNINKSYSIFRHIKGEKEMKTLVASIKHL